MLIECFQDERGANLWKYAEIIKKDDEKLGYMESVLAGKQILLGLMFEPKTAANLFKCIKPFFSPSDEITIFSTLTSNAPCQTLQASTTSS